MNTQDEDQNEQQMEGITQKTIELHKRLLRAEAAWNEENNVEDKGYKKPNWELA